MVSSANLYDPSNGRWTPTGSLNRGRAGDAALLSDGRVLLNGGGRFAEVYSPATGTWTPTGNNVYGDTAGALALLGAGRALAAGGSFDECDNEGGCYFVYVTTAEVFTP